MPQQADLMQSPATNPGSKKMMNPMNVGDDDDSEDDALTPAPAPGSASSQQLDESGSNSMSQPGASVTSVGSGSIGASSVNGSAVSVGTAGSDDDSGTAYFV